MKEKLYGFMASSLTINLQSFFYDCIRTHDNDLYRREQQPNRVVTLIALVMEDISDWDGNS